MTCKETFTLELREAAKKVEKRGGYRLSGGPLKRHNFFAASPYKTVLQSLNWVQL